MIAPIILTAIIGQQTNSQPPFWTPMALRQTEKFQVISSNRVQCRCERKNDRVVFSLRVQNMVAPGDIDTGAWTSTRDTPMSGVRIGESFAYIRSASSYVVKARTHFELGTVIISSPIIRDGRSRIPAQRDMSAEDDLIEKLLRESIARYAFRRLKTPTTVRVNGHVIPALVATGSDERYVDLAKWAAARNVSINRNDAENRFAFVFDGEQRIYYWGSKGIRRGRVTQYMIDIVMLNGSQIWVPIANLDL